MFLNYFEASLEAMLPSVSKESWWFGPERVGFGRFSDPVKPLAYIGSDGKRVCVMDCK
jgi:hypothetical protein